MRSLTKSGIRELTAKYRSVLKKCALLNAMVLMLGATPTFAIMSTPWEMLESAIEETNDNPIILDADIERSEYGGDITVNRLVKIEGEGHTLSGVGTYQGLTVGAGGNLTLQNITMQNFNNTSTVGGAIYNQNGTISSITGDFINNKSEGYGGGAISNVGTIKSITGNFKGNTTDKSGGAVSNSSGKEINFVAENNKDIRFEGNYVTSNTGKGGAIYNVLGGKVGLYADEGRSITFVGGENVIDTAHPENSKYDIDGIFNVGNTFIEHVSNHQHNFYQKSCLIKYRIY